MKGYSEQRGVQSQVIFDASTGQFAQREIMHDFASLAKTLPDSPQSAIIIDLQHNKDRAEATALSRSRRNAVMQKFKVQRVR